MAVVVFVASKLFWIVAAPGNLLLLALVVGVVRLVATKRRRGVRLVVAATAALLAIATLPLAQWIAAPLENRFPAATSPPKRVDGIIVLGGAVDAGLSEIRGQPVLDDAAERITATVALARSFPAARILVSGGDAEIVTRGLFEADATRELLVALGVERDRIATDNRSRNTWENAVYSRPATEVGPGETWLLVTSAMHMPRAVGCFRKAGWRITPYPVDYHTLPWLKPIRLGLAFAESLSLFNLAAKEWVGLLAYRLLGRSAALFPAPDAA